MTTSNFKPDSVVSPRMSLRLLLLCLLFLHVKQVQVWALRSPNPNPTLDHLQIKTRLLSPRHLTNRRKRMKKTLIQTTKKARTKREEQAIYASLNKIQLPKDLFKTGPWKTSIYPI